LGVKVTPIAEPEVGFLDVDKAVRARARLAPISEHHEFVPMARLASIVIVLREPEGGGGESKHVGFRHRDLVVGRGKVDERIKHL
jgi:hypothetical protein